MGQSVVGTFRYRSALRISYRLRDEMLRLLSVCLSLSNVCLLCSACFGQVKVGVYFDPGCTSSCISNAVDVPLDAYIVAECADGAVSISGWEGRIGADVGITTVLVETYGGGLNVGTYPDIVVGFNNPAVIDNGYYVLAKISLLASCEGGVYLSAASNPAIPGSVVPIYVLSDSPGIYYEMMMNAPYDDSAQALFTDDCDADVNQQGTYIDVYSIEGASEYSPLIEGTLFDDSPMNYSLDSDLNWEHMLNIVDYCFIGEVDSVIDKCLSIPGEGIQSLSFIQFDILEPYWGVTGNTMAVDAVTQSGPSCIEYSKLLFSEICPGEQYLVFGEYDDGRYRCTDSGLYRHIEGEFIDPGDACIKLASPKQRIIAFNHKRSMRDKASHSDVVCDVVIDSVEKQDDAMLATASVLSVHRGVIAYDSIELVLRHNLNPDRYDEYLIAPRLDVGSKYLMYLDVLDGKKCSLIRGMHGAYRISDKYLYTPRGYKWGAHGLAIAIAGGYDYD